MTKTKFLLQRAAGYLTGFALFYEPFMFFGRLTSSFLVETGFTSIHVPCARIPLSNIVTGQWLESGPTSLFFCLLLAVTSLWFGPLFCGRLCPAGAFSELLSKALPPKYQLDLARQLPLTPLRCSFFVGFLFSVWLGLGVPCAYCNYYALELFVGYLHTGVLFSTSLSLLATFLLANVLLGLFTKGGRGYCNLLCPVGAFNSLCHVIGQYLPGPFKMQVNKAKCVGCGKCAKACPMQAIKLDGRKAAIDIKHCIVCGQCKETCPLKAISYRSNIYKEDAGHEAQSK